MQSNEFLNQVNELLKSKQEALAVRLSRIQRYELAMEAASKLGKQLPNQEQIKSRAAGLSQQAHAFNQLHLLLIDNSLNEDEKLLRLPSILGTISTMVLIDPDYPDQTCAVRAATYRFSTGRQFHLKSEFDTTIGPCFGRLNRIWRNANLLAMCQPSTVPH